MITAGIDCGAKNTKTVIIKDREIIGKGTVQTGFDQKKAVEESLADIFWYGYFFRCGLVQGYRFTQGIHNDPAVVAILHMQFNLVAQLLWYIPIVISRE